MIKKINMNKTATFDELGCKLSLKKINYIFGSNGTGKTTISEFLRSKESSSSCSIEWEHNTPQDIYVYNRHFVDENFNVRNAIKGIFTLGKESTDLLNKIDEISGEIVKHKEKIGRLDSNIDTVKVEIENVETRFMNQCWDVKLKYDEAFKKAFKGLRNKKEYFMSRCVKEAKNNDCDLHTFIDLKKRVESVFEGNKDKIRSIPEIYYDVSIERKPIFKEKIIGKEDINISKLISKLNISDWVRQGRNYINLSDDLCPFCQQKLPLKFKELLDEYFDETYTEQLALLKSSSENYSKVIQLILDKQHFLTDEYMPFGDIGKIKHFFEMIDSIYKENKQILEKKSSEPSRSVELNPIAKYIKQINEEIRQINTQINEHNRLIDNIKEEKAKLTKDIWRFVVEENKRNYEYFKSESTSKNRALSGMKKRKVEIDEFSRKLEQDIIQHQNQLTSTLPSINEINKLLKCFGFTNFHLDESEEKGNYKIVREDGCDANDTLSEGEKTFITFLYFYQLINGSNEKGKVKTKRAIVIDDPISSLDSNILFVVSNLINGLKQKIRNNDSTFKQLIIFTHNVYFHKEVSFNIGQGSQKLNDETFWILTKVYNVSHAKEYNENPIKNSYELLWKELKDNPNPITTPNIMRRILENYFKFFGNIDVNKIIEGFPEEDKVVCHSLLSWANDGSHHVNDDLYVDINPESSRIYFDVFKRIFKNSDQGAHFDMMMGVQRGESEKNKDKIEGINESQGEVAASKEKLS
ncbi:AAA family ATPase [Sporolactobacillus terrae]|uniref:AAA family ATPase n=1 Tax=Sporolactobacillus terrae TaxID=269673 RepID=UPI00048D498F|nr:AAA family ATPase [Sporolactobacillus terrae]